MELHAINRVAAVLHGHDLGVLGAVGAPGGDDEIFWQGGRLYGERGVAHARERGRYTLEQLDEVVGERIVVVENEEHRGLADQLRKRSASCCSRSSPAARARSRIRRTCSRSRGSPQ